MTKKTKKETLQTCVRKFRSGERRACLDGCPVGGWGETAQARSRMREELPPRDERDYVLSDVVEALYTIDHADRYRYRA